MSVSIRVLKPGSRTAHPFQSVSLAIAEIYRSRSIVWQLFRRDFLAQFQQRLLGYLWALLAPLFAVAGFLIMNLSGVLAPGPLGLPYVSFALSGTLLWSVLTSSTLLLSNTLIGQGDLITRTNVPKLALVLAGTSQIIYNQLFNFLLLLGVSVFFGAPPTWGVFLYPVLVLPLFLLGTGLGFFLSVVNVIARDVSNVFQMALQILMFFSPVVFVPQFVNPRLQFLVEWNPLAPLISFPRQVIYFGSFQNASPFLWSVIFCLFVFVLGLHSFYLLEDKVAERL